jgi:hypothetical protein
VASAFISYAHEEQEFVLAMVEHLQAQGLDVRYDRVVLHIGDSLIRAISQEITEGDFLIAVISPDSIVSDWCQREVALESGSMTCATASSRWHSTVEPLWPRQPSLPAMPTLG